MHRRAIMDGYVMEEYGGYPPYQVNFGNYWHSSNENTHSLIDLEEKSTLLKIIKKRNEVESDLIFCLMVSGQCDHSL